jgi:hypothetical protein
MSNPPPKRSPRLLTTLALALLALQAVAEPAAAHSEPVGPGVQPMLRVELRVTGIAALTDQDDGPDDNAELDLLWALDHQGHYVTPCAPQEELCAFLRATITTNYDWDTYHGALQAQDDLLYSHTECGPMNRIEFQTHVVEVDGAPAYDDYLGSELEVFDAPGTYLLDAGLARVRVEVTTEGVGLCGYLLPPIGPLPVHLPH